MILEKEEIDARLSSPENLLNRLRRLSNPSQIVSLPESIQDKSSSSRPSSPLIPPSVDELVENLQDKLATAKCYSGAKEVLANSIERLRDRLDEVDSPLQLSKIASDMGRIVSGMDENKREVKSTSIPIIYRPVMLNEQNFQTIVLNE